MTKSPMGAEDWIQLCNEIVELLSSMLWGVGFLAAHNHERDEAAFMLNQTIGPWGSTAS